jgi:cob(I)alamin adenosyltransferase
MVVLQLFEFGTQLFMKIYTKTGDSGKTSLLGGKRTEKNCIEMQAIGEIDELNAYIGLLLAEIKKDSYYYPDIKKNILKIQNNLFIIGANLAAVQTKLSNIPKLTEDDISNIEKQIDAISENLPKLKQFILPGGTKEATTSYLARTICRRAERKIIEVSKQYEIDPKIKKYINRLSDYLFVLARWLNYENNIEEIQWNTKN